MIGRLTARRAWLGLAVVIVAALPWLLDTSYWRGILVLCAMNVLLALSLNLVIGYTRSEERRVGKECRSRWS